MLKISRQAINEAIKKKLLTVTLEDKRKKINIESKKTKIYIKSQHRNRKNIMQKITQGKKKDSKQKGNTEVKKKQVKDELIIYPDESGNESTEDFEYSIMYAKARAEKEKEIVIQKKLLNAKTRGELLDRESVYTSIIMYLDKVHSNLERLSDSYLSDVGSGIVTAGKVTPAIRNRWRSAVMEQIDDAKKMVVKKIKEIEREQSG